MAFVQSVDEQARQAVENVLLAYFPTRSLTNNDITFALAMGNSPPPIVTAEELFAAKSLRPNHLGSGIIQISPSTVVKFGRHVSMSEAETMDLLARKVPHVPIPKLKNAYAIAGVGYIVMEYSRGNLLGDCWSSMRPVQRQVVATQLQQYVSSWRRIRGPYFGTVNGGPCKERLFNHSYENADKSYGPYTTRKDYNCGLVRALQCSRPPHVPIAPSLESQIMESSGKDMVLTHGDLHMDNIVIGYNGEIAAILDWGESCYSTQEMEYCCARWGTQNNEWQSYIPCFVPQFPTEFKFWDNLNNEMMVYSGI